jgi:fructokinase
MITIAGEALMDVLVGVSGSLTAFPGGGPFNVARTIARLGGECQFLGTISDDRFGDELRTGLERDGVRIAVPRATPAPTTLAIAQLDATGSADYRFYLEGTSASQLRPADIPPDIFQTTDAIALGGLGILVEPTASSLHALIPTAPPEATVLLDPNGRPRAIKELGGYRSSVTAFLGRVDIVKVSVDDLKLLDPYADARRAARGLLAFGPAAVLVTDGPARVSLHTTAGDRFAPVPSTDVVDTIGAGDAFVAALLTWWTKQSLKREHVGDPDRLHEAATAAIQVAVAACTVRGANLPDGFDWSNTGAAPPSSASYS